MNIYYYVFLLLTIVYSTDYNYFLTDINSTSDTYGTNISPVYFSSQVTLHYFGHQNWGACSERVGYLDELYKDLLSADIDNVKIIAIGREEFSSNNENWTNGKDIPVLVDPSPYNTWSNWEAGQRDLFFLDAAGNFITYFSITPWDYGGNIYSDDLVYIQINSIIENDTDNALNIHSHPENISLMNAYPNPFNPLTNIIFTISQGSNSLITVYDMEGRYIETLSKSYFFPGNYTLTWNAAEYTSGIYFIQLELDSYLITQKLVLAK